MVEAGRRIKDFPLRINRWPADLRLAGVNIAYLSLLRSLTSLITSSATLRGQAM